MKNSRKNENEMSIQRKLIGEGERGLVIYPSFSGDINYVSKIAERKEIEKEIRNIKSLPNNVLYKLPENPILREIGTHELEIILQIEDLEDGTSMIDPCYIDLPYIEGIILSDIIEEYDYRFLCDLDIFIKNVKELHKLGYYHGAIFLQNIIYDGNRLYLIDFGTCGKITDIWKEAEKENLQELYDLFYEQQ